MKCAICGKGATRMIEMRAEGGWSQRVTEYEFRCNEHKE